MNRYERTYGADWDTLDRDEAVERAYALGVAASLGERHPRELDAVRGEVATTYDKSVVDLAFNEGKNEAREIEPSLADDEAVWSDLVAGETVTVEVEELPTGGRTGLPDAVERIDALDRPDLDSTEAVDRPGFLERE